MATLSTDCNALIERFRERATRLRGISYIILTLVFILLFAGIALFAGADVLVRWQKGMAEKDFLKNLAGSLENLKPYMNKTSPFAEQALDYITSLNRNLEAMPMEDVSRLLSSHERLLEDIRIFVSEARRAVTKDPDKLLQAVNTSDSKIQKYLQDPNLWNNIYGTVESTHQIVKEDIPFSLQVIESMYGSLNAFTKELLVSAERVTSLIKNYDTYVSGRLKQINEDKELLSGNFLSSLITRLGALLILFFLVQIMVSLYRYSMRLSSFYDARADALELLSQEDGLNVADVIRSLSPDELGFGPDIQTPIQQVGDLAKSVLTKK